MKAAAARYIEGRLSKFALEVAFNAKTTEWQLSYDGRKNEPVTLTDEIPFVACPGCRWNCGRSFYKNSPSQF
jgi:topoisomerase-4 subunit A